MRSFAGLEGQLWLLTIVLTVGMLLRFVQLRLHSVYPLFSILAFTALARSLIVVFVPIKPYWYAVYFMATEGLLFVFYVLATLEVFSLVFQRFPGIHSLSRWVTAGALLTATLLAAVSLYPDVMAKPQMGPLEVFLVAERGVLFGLAVLILLLGAFLAWFPVVLPRNVAVHSMLFSTYFLTKAAAILVRNISQTPMGQVSSIAILMISSVCMLLWIVLLRRAGEAATMVVGNPWSRTREEELVGQLRAINSTLAGAGRE